MESLQECLKEELIEAFSLIDKNEDGLLDKFDLFLLLKNVGIGMSLDDIAKSISRLSENEQTSTEYITLPQFIEILGRVLSKKDSNEELDYLFRSLDRDRDGYVDAAEIAPRMSKVVEQINKEEVNLLLDSITTEEHQMLSCDEFSSFLKSGFINN